MSTTPETSEGRGLDADERCDVCDGGLSAEEAKSLCWDCWTHWTPFSNLHRSTATDTNPLQDRLARLERERDELRQTVADVLWMARRYAHGRHTYAPSVVEGSYRRLGRLSGDPDTTLDCTLDGDCLCDSCLLARLDTQTGDDDGR